MRLRFVRASRLPRVPWWAVLLVVLWGALILATIILQRRAGTDFSLCAFKNLTGLPCPSCGSTRAAEALLAGHPVRAWLFNPLVCTAIAVAGVVLAVRLVSARAIRLEMSHREVHAVTAVLILLLLINWAYLILQGY